VSIWALAASIGLRWTPGLHFDWATGQGSPFRYFTVGCAVSEVCVDRSTGFVEVEQVDILMDVGSSINPGIDRGQIIGGFVQGMGWALREELAYDHGRLTSNALSTYKIPTIDDVPEAFYVTLVPNFDPDCLVGAKGVGGPPLVLGLSVWTAVHHELSHIYPGATTRLDLPSTLERVRMEIHRLQASSKNNTLGLEERIPMSRG
jgi:xanthine dehydrogenase large subunit